VRASFQLIYSPYDGDSRGLGPVEGDKEDSISLKSLKKSLKSE